MSGMRKNEAGTRLFGKTRPNRTIAPAATWSENWVLDLSASDRRDLVRDRETARMGSLAPMRPIRTF